MPRPTATDPRAAAPAGGALVLLLACTPDAPPSVATDGSSGPGSTGPASADETATTASEPTGTGLPPCEVVPFEDDLRVDDAAAIALDDDVVRMVALSDRMLACGRGFVQLAGGPPLAIDGACTGLAAVEGERAVAVTDAGATLLLTLEGDAATALDTVEEPGVRHEDVTIHDGAIFVASGPDGLRRFDAQPDALGALTPVPGATDARGVASVAAGLLVADGTAGARLVDAEGGGSISTLALDPRAEPARLARRVVADGERAYVLRGAFGVSVVDVADSSLSLTASIATEGIALDAAPVDGGLLVATGSALVRISLSAAEAPVVVSRQARPAYGTLDGGWFRTVSAADDGPWASVGERIAPVSLGAGAPQPLLHVDRATYSFWADAGESTETIVTFDNRGAAPMVVAELGADPFDVEPLALDERPGCPGQYVVEAAGRGLVTLTYPDPSPELVLGSFTAITDTSDDAMFALRVEVNRPLAELSQPAPTFEVLTHEGQRLRATDFSDRVVFVKVFNET